MRRDDGGAGYRHARLEGLILEELRAILRDDVTDPALSSVRPTTCTLSPDYKHVRVHYAALRSAFGLAEVERALSRAAPFVRARLAEAIELKRTPELRFVFDAEPYEAPLAELHSDPETRSSEEDEPCE